MGRAGSNKPSAAKQQNIGLMHMYVHGELPNMVLAAAAGRSSACGPAAHPRQSRSDPKCSNLLCNHKLPVPGTQACMSSNPPKKLALTTFRASPHPGLQARGQKQKHSLHPRTACDSGGNLCRSGQLTAVHEVTDLRVCAHIDPPGSLPTRETVLGPRRRLNGRNP